MPAARFVTLPAYTTLPEARQAAERLKAAGIPAYIRGEAAALIAADPEQTVVRLQVIEDDLEHAERVLASPPGAESIRSVRPDRQSPPEAADDATHPDADRLATVEVFYDSLDAKHAADLLRAKGIPCRLEGRSEGVLPGLGPGIVSLRLSVREADLERAYAVLGFTVDDGEGDEDDLPGGSAPKSDHFQEAEPGSAREVKRPPFVQPEAEALPVESTSAADDLGPQPPLPTVEAGSEGPDIGLMLMLLVLGGFAVASAIWFVLL